MTVHLNIRKVDNSVLGTYLRLDQDQVNENNHEIILDVLVGESLAARALRQAHAFAQGSVIGAAVGAIEM